MNARKRKTDQVKLKYNSPPVLVLPIEQSFTELHQSNGSEVAEGDRRRVVELPIPPRKKGGIFDLDETDDTKRMAEDLKRFAASQDGCLMNDWITAIGELDPKKVQSLYKRCCRKEPGGKSWTKRPRGNEPQDFVTDNLDHLWFTARLLYKVGQLPVSLNHVAKCLRTVDRQNTKIITGHGDPLQRKIRGEIFLLFRDEDLFPKVETGESVRKKSNKAIGFVRKQNGQDHIYVVREALKERFPEAQSDQVDACMQSLINRGYGQKPKGSYTKPVKQKGFKSKKSGRPRCWELFVDNNRKPIKG